MIEACVNDELDDDNINNAIEENEEKLNDKDRDDTEINDKEGYDKTDTESSTSKETDDTHKWE